MKNRFDKRIFSAKLFFKDIGFLILNLQTFIGVAKNKQISKAFIERIMIVTTAVNDCVYCSWFHAKRALDSGISEREIKNMMKLQFKADAPEFELLAILYSQHYAETNRKPEKEITKKLFDYYGGATSKQIILIIRTIYFGNLYGNTWDAVLSRFKGVPAVKSNVVFELFFFLLNFIIAIPFTLIMKYDKKSINLV